MGSSFVHLHLHTEFSMLDGAARIPDVIATAAADGQPAVGITDHGNMYGVLDFYRAAREADLTPVIGSEAYFVSTSRFDRPKRADHDIYHLTLLAETNAGYRNLIKVASNAYLDGFYYKPRIDFELLEQHRAGLIATSGCLGGLVCQQLMAGDYTGRTRQRGALPGHPRARLLLHRAPGPRPARAAQRQPATREDGTRARGAAARDERLALHAQGGRRGPRRAVVRPDRRHDRRPQPVQVRRRRVLPEDRGGDARRCSRNTRRRATTRCSSPSAPTSRSSSASPSCPRSRCPAGHDEDSYLRELTLEGAKDRYGQSPALHVLERIEYELGVIKDMGFSAYFLVVWDLVRYARSRGIRVGPGRGSAAGSCVAYCLRVVDVDPIRYDLLFERFLNPGRKQMPDIDMDFDERYRGEIIKYAAQRYGWDRVAQVVTFSTIKARAAVRDASRVLGYPWGVGDRIAKLMPPLDHGPRHAAARVPREGHGPRGRLQDGRRAARPVRLRSRRQARDRRRPRPRGPAPPGRHPRRRRRDHPGAAHRVPPDPAQAGARRRHRGRPDRHPVRDARRRGPRPAQDGLPRAAEPLGDRAHASS